MRIDWAGYCVLKRGHSYVHSHAEGYELHLIEKAHGTLVNGATQLRVRDGDLILSKPGESHDIWPAINRGEARFHVLMFAPTPDDTDLVEEFCAVFPQGGRLKVNAAVGLVFDRIRNKTYSNHVHLKKSAVYDLLALLHELAASGTTPQSDVASRGVDHLIRILNENVCGTVSMDDLARRLKMGKSYMIRCFTKKMGLPPLRYFIKMKIDTACQWLQWSNDPVNRIATKLSFYDEFHFSRTFKRLTGLSPSEYRKRRRTGDASLPEM